MKHLNDASYALFEHTSAAGNLDIDGSQKYHGVSDGNRLHFKIQDGPIKEVGVNGIQATDLLFFCKELFKSLNKSFFRKSKKMVVVWALIHIAMGIKIHMALVLIPIGFLFKYIYDKKGLNHAYAMHFATNILIVVALFLSFIS